MKQLKISYFNRFGFQLLLATILFITIINMTINFDDIFPINRDAIWGVLFLLIWPLYSFWLLFNKSLVLIFENNYLIIINIFNGKIKKFNISKIKGYYVVLMSENIVFVDEENKKIFSIHEPFYKKANSFIDSLNIPKLGSRII